MVESKYTSTELLKNEVFLKYYDFLITENEKYNLTSIKIKNEVFVKHFSDSLQILKYDILNMNATVCDVGSGAGFPLIPILLYRNDLKGTVIESNYKKTNFLLKLKELLAINNLEIFNERVEESAFKEVFDVVIVRAVAKINILLELVAKTVKVNGKIILWKSVGYEQELTMCKNALDLLDLKLMDILVRILKLIKIL
jgi:16S rRNA (guanine527-N7)-methyltransferase